MTLRFRKSFKLAPGVRMNLSGSGASWSIGPRGATIGIGKRGAHLNTSIPAIGISARQRIGGSTAKSKNIEQPTLQSLVVSISVSDDGTIMFNDSAGNELPDKLIRVVKRQQGETIKGLIQKKCDEINQEVDSVGEIHIHTPAPTERPKYFPMKYHQEKPAEPIPKKLGFIRALFKSQREKLEKENCKALSDYQGCLNQWDAQRILFEAEEVRRKVLIEESIYKDLEAMTEFLECALQEIVWPRETSVSTEIHAGGTVVFIDVDLPEIEDMPSRKAAVPANGYKLTVKDISASNVQKLYMQHVHGVAFRIVGEVFAALPKAEEVVMSGYSQRPQKATGQISDEYLLSVRVKRPDWSRLAFENLSAVDVIESLGKFELRRTMSKTGIFKPIEPYSPNELP